MPKHKKLTLNTQKEKKKKLHYIICTFIQKSDDDLDDTRLNLSIQTQKGVRIIFKVRTEHIFHMYLD